MYAIDLFSQHIHGGNSIIVLFQCFVSLSDVNHNRERDGRASEHKQRENIQEGKKYDNSNYSLTVFGFIYLLRQMITCLHNIYFGMS